MQGLGSEPGNRASVPGQLHNGDMAIELDTSVQYLTGVGPRRASALGRLGVETVLDVLHHYPRRHEDRRSLSTMASVTPGEVATVSGHVPRSGCVAAVSRAM